VSDNRMKDRVKVLLNGTSSDSQTSEHAVVGQQPQQQGQQGPQQGVPGAPGAHPNQALQVLTLAQRTAEEHVARAHHQADKIRTDALAAAEQVARDAQVHAHNVRREAEKILTDARAAAEQIARDSHARTEEARRNAEKIVNDARAQSGQIAEDAQANADHLNLQARQRYDDVVGSLGTKREALQDQIEALEQFDREYRGRLTTFMQNQLRALWVDQPQVAGELALNQIDEPRAEGPAPAGPVATGPRHGNDDQADDTVPTQRQSPEEDGADESDERSDRKA
jgi:cell division septum initiation protein DivIVA